MGFEHMRGKTYRQVDMAKKNIFWCFFSVFCHIFPSKPRLKESQMAEIWHTVAHGHWEDTCKILGNWLKWFRHSGTKYLWVSKILGFFLAISGLICMLLIVNCYFFLFFGSQMSIHTHRQILEAKIEVFNKL